MKSPIVKFGLNPPAYYTCDCCGVKKTQLYCMNCHRCVCLKCVPDHLSRHQNGLIEPHARASVLQRIKQWLKNRPLKRS